MSKNVLPEWSHKIEADDIGATPISTTISASPQERKDIARRAQVESIEFLQAQLVMERQQKNLVVYVSGTLKAQLTQICVATLEPIKQDIETTMEGWFADTESAVSLAKVRHEKQGKKVDAELPMLEEEDAPEPILEGQIDLGELATQHLILAIDPYPHKEGAEPVQAIDEEQAASRVRQNPFAALKNWKKGRQE